jgi:hypothetical protein
MERCNRIKRSCANNVRCVANGFGNFIREKQRQLEAKGEKQKLYFIIKPLPSSTYQNVIAALDETLINNLQHYTVVDVTPEEKKFVESQYQ